MLGRDSEMRPVKSLGLKFVRQTYEQHGNLRILRGFDSLAYVGFRRSLFLFLCQRISVRIGEAYALLKHCVIGVVKLYSIDY